MKSFQSLIVILAAILMASTPVVTGSPLTLRATEKQSQLERALVEDDKKQRKLGFHVPNPFHPHPPPKKPDTSSTTDSGSDNGGSDNGSYSYSDSNSAAASSSAANAAQSSDSSAEASPKSLMVMLGVAAAAGMAIAAIAIPRRKVATEDHALKGSLNKRIALFSNLAKHAPSRPPRRDETGRYINADDMA